MVSIPLAELLLGFLGREEDGAGGGRRCVQYDTEAPIGPQTG
jgi:hypothetical protein